MKKHNYFEREHSKKLSNTKGDNPMSGQDKKSAGTTMPTASASFMKLLETPSKYCYHPGMQYKLYSESRIKDYTHIERAILEEDVHYSDLLLLKIIAELDFATAQQIMSYISLIRHNEPGIIYPTGEERNIKQALTRLCRNSLARGFKYEANDIGFETPIVYTISDAGLDVIKYRLYYKNKKVTAMNALQPPEEAFRRLACNEVTLALAKQLKCDFQTTKNTYVQNYGKTMLYGQLECQIDGKEVMVMIEPMYFECNRNIVSKEQMKKFVLERMEVVKKQRMFFADKKHYTVFVIEHKEYLDEALKILCNSFSGELSNLYITSESVLYKTKVTQNAFIRLIPSEIEGKFNLRYSCGGPMFVD